jgi:hypothetical protein
MGMGVGTLLGLFICLRFLVLSVGGVGFVTMI